MTDGSDEEDPLEAFMAGIEKELKSEDGKSDKQKEKEKVYTNPTLDYSNDE